jgi:7-keto-8-aminopelargonate synthetase-like enzyme
MTEAEPLRLVGWNEVLSGRRRLAYFSGCDYFRLGRDPVLRRAARAALREHGLNVAASRRTTGNHPVYLALEQQLARFFGRESAVLVPDGYLAPVAAAQALAGEFTHVFIDELAHAALVDASRMLGRPAKKFRHRDAAGLRKLMRGLRPAARPLVLTDGLFAHDGSVAPLAAYVAALPAQGMVLLDDAHGAGVLGRHGRGTPELESVPADRLVQCLTLSKAFGAYGGAVLVDRALREKILGRSRLFTGTTPPPPMLAGAALAAVRELRSGHQRRRRLAANTGLVRAGLADHGWKIVATPGPIIRLPSMSPEATDGLKAALLAAGIYPPFLKYGASAGNGFFRFVISSEHSAAQLRRLIGVVGPFARNI